MGDSACRGSACRGGLLRGVGGSGFKGGLHLGVGGQIPLSPELQKRAVRILLECFLGDIRIFSPRHDNNFYYLQTSQN